MGNDSYEEHLRTVLSGIREAIRSLSYDTLIIHSGTPSSYHADDQDVPFRALPHFIRLAPVRTPHHLIVIKNDDSTPTCIEVKPEDYWLSYEESDFWKPFYLHETVATPQNAWERVRTTLGRAVFIGDAASVSEALTSLGTVETNPPELLKKLDELRSVKTGYEISCIREANRIAATGHTAARDAFLSGASEFEIHIAFLQAVECTEAELPYPTITALNEKSATLHYQHKRLDVHNASTFLMDAGYAHRGYASDITRTYAKNSAHEIFRQLIENVRALQKKLVSSVKPGVQFIELHHEAHLGIASILKDAGILLMEPEEAIQEGVTRAFFPHGLGHMLGLQVHDVGGTREEPFQHALKVLYPKIRTNRVLVDGNVTTIEPGLYFIPLLLAPLRNSHQREIAWKVVDELIPMGGIRFEDDVLVTQSGNVNLTEPYLP